MNNIISSASKIVFIMMALGVNVALFLGKINGDQYLSMVGICFTFYFTKSDRLSASASIGKDAR